MAGPTRSIEPWAGCSSPRGYNWGFDTGILLDASSASTLAGYVVDGVRVELNRDTGIDVKGANSIVRHTLVANTGPTTLPGLHETVGILIESDGGRVLDNDVITVTSSGPAVPASGIIVTNGLNDLVVGNRLTAVEFGLIFSNASGGKYRDNLTSGVGIPFTVSMDIIDAGNNN